MEVKYFNSFWLKKVCEEPDPVTAEVLLPSWPGLPWPLVDYPIFPFNGGTFAPIGSQGDETAYQEPWAIEEMRIKGGFNNTPIDLGVKAYIVEERTKQEHLKSSLIYSGIFNSRTGVNNTNVFSIAKDITKSVDPINGSIQRLYAEDTNLIIFQENKVHRALIDKDAVYTAEGSAMQTQSNVVIGQIVPYLGEYGISTNPESFAIYGFQKYFADRNRGAILRLSRDGITEISTYGMNDYFRDELASINDDQFSESTTATIVGWTYILDPLPLPQIYHKEIFLDIEETCCSIKVGSSFYYNPQGGTPIPNNEYFVVSITPALGYCRVRLNKSIVGNQPQFGDEVSLVNKYKSQILGGWDIHNKNYVVSIQNVSKVYTDTNTSPKIEDGTGDYSTVTFDEMINGWTSFHHYKPAFIGSLKNKYYSFFNSGLYEHYYNAIYDDNRGLYYSTYNTTSQEWYPARVDSSISFVFNPNPSVVKNFKTIAYEGSNGWEGDYFVSGMTGKDPLPGVTGTVWVENKDQINSIYSYDEGLYNTEAGYPARAGFDRKENMYTTNIINTSAPRAGEVISSGMTGIKGYFSTVRLTTDETTDPGGMKELYSVSSEFVLSSY